MLDEEDDEVDVEELVLLDEVDVLDEVVWLVLEDVEVEVDVEELVLVLDDVVVVVAVAEPHPMSVIRWRASEGLWSALV